MAVGPNSQALFDDLKQEYSIAGVEDTPTLYIGMTSKVNDTRTGWILSAEKYIEHIMSNIESLTGSKLV